MLHLVRDRVIACYVCMCVTPREYVVCWYIFWQTNILTAMFVCACACACVNLSVFVMYVCVCNMLHLLKEAVTACHVCMYVRMCAWLYVICKSVWLPAISIRMHICCVCAHAVRNFPPPCIARHVTISSEADAVLIGIYVWYIYLYTFVSE
jgi:hypothetical protein